jgi:hypothetical protein
MTALCQQPLRPAIGRNRPRPSSSSSSSKNPFFPRYEPRTARWGWIWGNSMHFKPRTKCRRFCGQLTRRFLSRRDDVIVAWQFTAWNRLETNFRPVRVRCDAGPRFFSAPGGRPNVIGNQTIPSLRDGLFFALSQAVNCQTTIIKSLRGKSCHLLSASSSQRGPFQKVFQHFRGTKLGKITWHSLLDPLSGRRR